MRSILENVVILDFKKKKKGNMLEALHWDLNFCA